MSNKTLQRLAKQVIPTRGRLEKKEPTIDTTCPLCYNDVECEEHLFIQGYLREGRNQLIFKNVKFCPISNAAADFNSANCANPIQTVRESPAG